MGEWKVSLANETGPPEPGVKFTAGRAYVLSETAENLRPDLRRALRGAVLLAMRTEDCCGGGAPQCWSFRPLSCVGQLPTEMVILDASAGTWREAVSDDFRGLGWT